MSGAAEVRSPQRAEHVSIMDAAEEGLGGIFDQTATTYCIASSTAAPETRPAA